MWCFDHKLSLGLSWTTRSSLTGKRPSPWRRHYFLSWLRHYTFWEQRRQLKIPDMRVSNNNFRAPLRRCRNRHLNEPYFTLCLKKRTIIIGMHHGSKIDRYCLILSIIHMWDNFGPNWSHCNEIFQVVFWNVVDCFDDLDKMVLLLFLLFNSLS